MTAHDDQSPVSGWTAPNVNAALPTAAAPGRSGRRFRPPNSGVLRPATAHFPALPGVDLPTQLPEPQPTRRPGSPPTSPAPPRCALWDSSTSSAERSTSRGNTAVLAIVWSCVWVPVAAVVALAGLADDRLGMLAQFIAALVVPVLLTGPLAAPIRGRDRRAMPLRAALATTFSGSRVTLGAIGAVLLAAPAILAGLTLAGLTSMAMQTVLIMALPVLYAIPLTVYLLVGAPIQMALVVVAVEGAPLLTAIRRALYPDGPGHGAPHRLDRPAGVALRHHRLRDPRRGALLLRCIAARAADHRRGGLPDRRRVRGHVHVDTRIRLEAYDVTLLAGQAR